ncbi:hypothetical protein K431DRAFT_289226 [Polychaeton citri CBS 116435]|uniref:ACB domain-containing protein n=1 Tax=Polychaeton citri CBS 116435 TaxID=1314669 RepID=A0A9P4UKT9_9PEZI|nr:hypothetical protein K431DRAFT_289226 [Polychaeton citri CBS 116435]
MADSVDRVFGHALNTVNKIRPGSNKPPAADRLALYGLYKQSMEGDVSLISSRPSSSANLSSSAAGGNANAAERLKREQEKWDAWRANEGLSRTDAKRRYIERLIETMHQYASGTEEARELVEELEFVWDQIKNNSLTSGQSERSSPLRTTSEVGRLDEIRPDAAGQKPLPPMRILSPMSQADEEEAAVRRLEEADYEQSPDADGDEFVDAPVSQIDIADIPEPEMEDEQPTRSNVARNTRNPKDQRFRTQVSQTLTRLTTEIAALREQLESRRFIKQQQRASLWSWVWRISWWGLQFLIADTFILLIIMWHLRRKGDGRLEGAVRVLLGDAVVASLREKVKEAGKGLPAPMKRIGAVGMLKRKGGGGGGGEGGNAGGGSTGADIG